MNPAGRETEDRYYFFLPASFFPASFFSPSLATPSFFCTVVGISAAATCGSRFLGSNGAGNDDGRHRQILALYEGREFPRPSGSLRSLKCKVFPAARSARSTVINSGRSLGRQETSSSVSTWLTMPPESFTPGAMSALMKCRGTFMCIFLFGSTR